MPIVIKSPKELELMRQAGHIVAEVLVILGEKVGPGVTTAELNAVADALIRKRGAVPSFMIPWLSLICASINAEVVHVFPARSACREGDLISVMRRSQGLSRRCG
jgi:methionyl aminopeptidase